MKTYSKRFYHSNQIFGGSSSSGDQEALLKTIQINENVLQGIELKSSSKLKAMCKLMKDKKTTFI